MKNIIRRIAGAVLFSTPFILLYIALVALHGFLWPTLLAIGVIGVLVLMVLGLHLMIDD